MGTVFELNRKKTFTLGAANDLLPLILKITSEADLDLQAALHAMAQARRNENLTEVDTMVAAAQAIFNKWENKIQKLGLEPKGIWLIDIDSGEGLYCWKYPELEIKFWHAYEDGFSRRLPINCSLKIGQDEEI